MGMIQKFLMLLSLIFGVTQFVAAQQLWSTRYEAVAIQGYDPIAYFAQKDAVKGRPEFYHQWAGTIWFFSSAENKTAFVAEPEKYAPQYGGFCALGVANGKLPRGSGEAWTIHQGKLYLFAGKDARSQWSRDILGNIQKADQEWPRLKNG